MKASVHTSIEKIRSYAGVWNDLLKNSRADNLFLTWEWVYSWFKVNELWIKPFVIIVKDCNHKIIGIAPFHLKIVKLFSAVNYRMLHIMADFATGSEYPDIIAAQTNEEQICKAIGEALKMCRHKWDCIWLPRMASWNGAEQRILTVCKNANATYKKRTAVFSAIQLPDNIEKLHEIYTGNSKALLKRQLRKITSQNNVEFVSCTKISQVKNYLENLFNLHKKRWNRKGEEGTFVKKPEEAEFYRRFVPLALKNNWLRFYGVKHFNEFKAIQIGYVYNNTFYQLQEGFDPDFVRGVGNVLRLRILEDCIRYGIKTYDFLYGFSEHKRRWKAEKRKGMDVLILGNHLKNIIIELGALWPTGRFMRRKYDYKKRIHK